MRKVTAGTTSYITHVFIQDETSTGNEGLAGLDNTKVAISFIRPGDTGDTAPAAINDISTLGTFAGDDTDFAFAPVDDVNMKGIYELHVSNNAIAAGANQVTISIQDVGDNNAAPTILQIKLATEEAITTSYITHIFIQDEAATDGSGLAGLDNTNVAISFIRPGDVGDTTVSINTIGTLGTFAGSDTAFAFAPVDDVTMKGVYELHVSNNAVAAGVDQVTISIQDAADNDAAPTILQIQLTVFGLVDITLEDNQVDLI